MQADKQIRLSGDCLLPTIGEQHRTLCESWGGEGPVAIDLAAVAAVDISLVQLLASASRTAARQNRPFRLMNMPASVEAACRSAGLDSALLP